MCKSLLVGTAMACALMSVAAQAQDAPVADISGDTNEVPGDGDTAGAGLNEILVTAQRREESRAGRRSVGGPQTFRVRGSAAEDRTTVGERADQTDARPVPVRGVGADGTGSEVVYERRGHQRARLQRLENVGG